MSTIDITRKSNGAVLIGSKEYPNPNGFTVKVRARRDSTISVLIKQGYDTILMCNASDLGNINGSPASTNVAALRDSLGNNVFSGSSDYAIAKVGQTITFGAIAGRVHTAPAFQLAATSDSGLAVTYVSSDPTKATVTSGGLVTPVAAGSTNITASQAGDANYNAATPVIQALVLS